MILKFPLPALVLLFAAGALAAQEASERQKIESERARVEAAYTEQQRECQARFTVTACSDQAKRTRRLALADLKRRGDALDEAQRKQRAQRKQQEIREKAAKAEATAKTPGVDAAAKAKAQPAQGAAQPQRSRLVEVVPKVREPGVPKVREPGAGGASAKAPRSLESEKAARAADAVKTPRAPQAVKAEAAKPVQPVSAASQAAADAARRAQEAQNRAEFEARRRTAQEHLRETMERNAQRASTRPPAAPLPQPGASRP